jgi:DNA polymerase elongation subunit (family B)
MRLGLKLEKWCKPVIFTEKSGKEVEGAKKCYGMHVLWQDGKAVDYVVVKGWSYVRRDSSPVCKHVEKAVLDIALKGSMDKKDQEFLCLPDKVNDDLILLVQLVRKKYLAGEFTLHDMSIPVAARKAIDDYDPVPATIRGIRYFNEHVAPKVGRPAIEPDATSRFLYVKRVAGLPATDVVVALDFDEMPPIDVDLNKMFDREVKGKLEKKLKVLGISWSRALGQTTMEDFL